MNAPGSAHAVAAAHRPIHGVVFDLDGTLVDSWALHCHCLRRAARSVGLAAPSAARLALAQRPTDLGTLEAVVGPDLAGPALTAYRQALGESLSAGPEGADAPRLPMPGAAGTVARLRSEGLAVGVCTGRSRIDAALLLDHSGIGIGLTVAREEAGRPKPAADGLLRALRLLGLTADEALYVGDSRADLVQGRAAGIRTLLVGPVGRLASLRDLLPIVEGEEGL